MMGASRVIRGNNYKQQCSRGIIIPVRGHHYLLDLLGLETNRS
ncbi:hypothetical protein AVDCRST_MAG81-3307 [uncultured Synechococcales cyanobacterium]|uniref:Uncharacterized protein n=1 Tax=uncultured Synechococcales cyanobacterium TaxID=1936017 RepID=A0A6J4VN09_9CYAN|nr:hypothetical protein AVDCRST_MAG81-3307 [uncultured Synechococcales cyanobacterium]